MVVGRWLASFLPSLCWFGWAEEKGRADDERKVHLPSSSLHFVAVGQTPKQAPPPLPALNSLCPSLPFSSHPSRPVPRPVPLHLCCAVVLSFAFLISPELTGLLGAVVFSSPCFQLRPACPACRSGSPRRREREKREGESCGTKCGYLARREKDKIDLEDSGVATCARWHAFWSPTWWPEGG